MELVREKFVKEWFEVGGIETTLQTTMIQKSKDYIGELESISDSIAFLLDQLGETEENNTFRKFYIKEMPRIDDLITSVATNIVIAEKNIPNKQELSKVLRQRQFVGQYLNCMVVVLETEVHRGS
jgi:hypothetical protein